MKNRKCPKFLRLFALALAAAGFYETLPAQDNALPSPSLITNDVSINRARRAVFNSAWRYDFADGITFEIKDTDLASGNGAVFELNLSDSADIFYFRPVTDVVEQNSGRFIFSNNRSAGYSGVAHLSRGILVLKNGSVINNSSATHGGAFTVGAYATFRAYNVLFEGNNTLGGGGVISFRTNLSNRPPQIISSSTFIGNYSTHSSSDAGGGGVMDFATGSADVNITDSAFINNRTGHSGGAIVFRLNAADLLLQDVTTINGNWAAQGGGFLYDRTGIGNLGKSIVISLTGTLAGRHIVYENNAAGGVATPVSEIVSGSYSFTPLARRGGFYFSQNVGALRFNIANDVTLSIGRTGNNPALDSLATNDSENGYKSVIDKVGAGRLILNADNSHFQGTTNVQAGSLILGNQNAMLGGVINIHSGATFGGSGRLTTLRANGTETASTTTKTFVSATTNAFLQVGTETAVDAERLTISGSLRMLDGFTISHDLFTSGSASLLQVKDISLVGSGTINLGLLATGSFMLAQWETGNVDINQLTLTIDGVASNPRSSGSLSLIVDGTNNKLIVSNTVNNLQMKWTGAAGSTWLRRPTDEERNWTDMSVSGENRFYNGDTVIFDGIADAGHEANRVITIETGGVISSGMEVSGTARYEFHGNGGIRTASDAVGNAEFAATGKLIKSGEGELVFANNAGNLFVGGIDISGGMITFDQARQLSTETSINFIDSGTLRTTGATTDRGTLQGDINIATGKTAVVEVSSGTLMHSLTAAVSSASTDSVLRKTGSGELRLFGDSSANTGMVAVDEGGLRLGIHAKLGGLITVGSGATLGGSGMAGMNGSVTVLSGGVLDIGIVPATAGKLTVNNLEMTGGGIVRVGLFSYAAEAGYNQSDRLIDTGASAISGVNIIDLKSFASGTFNLGNVTGLANNSSVTISGMTIPVGGRLTASLSVTGSILQLVAESDKSRLMTWTGNGGAVWNLTQENWTGSDSMIAYSYGDHVVFDGTADSANAANRNIFINATEVRISDMTVSGDVDYTFTGGGINTDANNVLANTAGEIDLTSATGKLTKTGNGTLTFDNDANTFEGGVDIDGGAIAISDGNQLTTSETAGIAFTGDAVIRATGSAVAINDSVSIASGKTGSFDSNGNAMTLSGIVSGATDSTFAKIGVGTLVLEADISAHTGTLAVNGGILQLTAQNVLGEAAAIVVDAGSTLDLNNHNQTITTLDGVGTIALGTADLKVNIDTGDATFGGAFAGEGKVSKTGASKWTLSGASTHTGGFVYEGGKLGLANSSALGAGTLTINTSSPVLSIDAADLNIPNDIAMGEYNTVIETNGQQVEFSGGITGNSELTIAGTGTAILSGRNSYTNLNVDVPYLVMRRAESASSLVTIKPGSLLEFRDVQGGDVNGAIKGDRVLFTSSTLTLRGSNELRDFEVGGGSYLTVEGVNTLGGSGADVIVRQGSAIRVIKPEVAARNMIIDGGAIVLANYYEMTSLRIAGSLEFINNGEVRLGALLPTGIYTAAIAEGGIPNMPHYNPNQEGMFMVVDIIDGKKLQLTAYNMAVEPGKDIVVGFDSMLSSMRAIYTHISEEFLTPVVDRKPGIGSGSLWTRFIGSFAEYGDDIDHLGYTDRTYAALVGFDWITKNNYMVGFYGGFNSTNLETTNDATTDIDTAYFGVYGAKRMGDFYASIDLLGGFGSADTVRREDQGNVVTGGYDIDSFGASFEIGYMLHPFSSGGLRPNIGLHYMNLNLRKYNETGVGAVRLDGMRAYALEAVFAVDLNREIKTPWGHPGMVDVRLGWRENLNTDQSEVWATMVDYPAARMRIRGDKYDGSGITCGIGLRMAFSSRVMFGFAYDFDYIPMGIHDNDTIRHTLNGIVRMSW